MPKVPQISRQMNIKGMCGVVNPSFDRGVCLGDFLRRKRLLPMFLGYSRVSPVREVGSKLPGKFLQVIHGEVCPALPVSLRRRRVLGGPFERLAEKLSQFPPSGRVADRRADCEARGHSSVDIRPDWPGR